MGSAKPEAWIANACGPCGPTRFNQGRTISGAVKMRLTDVSLSSGQQWQYATFSVDLVDVSGAVHASGNLSKSWGVPAAFVSLGFIPTPRVLYLRMAPNVGPAGCCDGMTFTSELTWT
jgi:hypothetical protein